MADEPDLLQQQAAASLQHMEQLLEQLCAALLQPAAPGLQRAAKGGFGGVRSSRSKPKELSYEDYPTFCQFWEIYPSTKGKYPALRAWIAAGAADDAALAARITEAAARYAADRTRNPDKTKHAQGWLNDRRWEDGSDVVPIPVRARAEYLEYGSPEWKAANPS